MLRHYRDFQSGFKDWDQRGHAKKWLLYPENLGPQLSIDETSLSRGELYTILTNKAAKGGRGSIVAIVAGTKAEVVIEVIRKIPEAQRKKVTEITLDMAGSMTMIAKRCFSQATRVTDRFHVQRLAVEALQELRIKHRWEALDRENDAIEQATVTQTEYVAEVLSNGDTVKQLLARSRYALYKKPNTWTENQKERAHLVFERFPDLKKAYDLAQELSNIFTNTTEKIYGLTRLAKWHEKVRQSGFKSFNTVARSIENHYKTIVNYFDNRSTNASAESFNAKIKAFRSQFRGVRNVEFFLYRLTQLYA
ncbi:transposase [Dyadobacter pollutisoli]|uniref:Transposase n=1 Tax=Dyadobacter pollutisoli TaxID=2910158 RepID=A0A9E8NK10_9BACT|nr:transposase [Dyadobacter pollutisoli]WAC15429.1 transposase [Dyadobacter pollutisoli]WAC15482.1 transposase [Dyadobacter pollutisoli]